MKNAFLILTFLPILFLSCTTENSTKLIELKTDGFQITLDRQGYFSHFMDLNNGKDYLSKDTLAPLMTIRRENTIILPQSAKLKENILTLFYNDDFEAEIKIEQKASHITFELLSLSNNDQVDLVIWGPYPTSINKVIGETVGVVQGEDFAIGIQSLNVKTLGGYPWNENDAMPQIDIFDQDDPNDMKEGGEKRYVLYRVEAAKPTQDGSSLQAYCRNRFEDRVVENLNHDRYAASAFEDGGVIGTKIALFGCPVNNVLENLEKIEIEENLPHPMIDGTWAKVSPLAASAYLIMEFGEENIEEAIETTQKAGLKYLYHPEPFETWGHFKLREEQFPNGVEGLKNCVVKADQQGIKVGLHTLSNFITTDDRYVTPVPDERLGKVGSSMLTEEVNDSQKEIPIESPDFFNQYRNNHLKTVMIGKELIRYGAVSETEPWKLLDCQRGAFNTIASSHSKDTEISKLADHGYKVFLTNMELGTEVAENLANLYNAAGLRQISFDGLEGNRSTGMGHYAETLFTKTWYDKLNEGIKDHYIADASRTTHFFWHIYSRMNWGEPWYAGFRESQTEYRLHNQKYFKRNLMPAMLGWFLMTPETSVEDIEWLLAKSAAFDAGYGFVIRKGELEKNELSDKILELLGDWEKLRIKGSFTEDQKERMKDINNEFSLVKSAENDWHLYQVYSNKFRHENKVRQPGEPLSSTFEFEHPGEEQTLNFILTATESEVSSIDIELDNYKKITLPISLKAGEIIKYTGGETASVFNKNWQLIHSFEIDETALRVVSGKHSVVFDCQFNNPGKDAMVKVELRTFGSPEKLNLSN